MSKLGVAFALFAAMAFSILAMGNLFSAAFTPLSYVPLAYSVVLGILFIVEFSRI